MGINQMQIYNLSKSDIFLIMIKKIIILIFLIAVVVVLAIFIKPNEQADQTNNVQQPVININSDITFNVPTTNDSRIVSPIPDLGQDRVILNPNPRIKNNDEPISNRRIIVNDPNIDTSNWNTFDEAGYGYTFKYPSEWKMTHSVESSVKNTHISYLGHTIIINEMDQKNYKPSGGEWVSQQSDYYLIKFPDAYLFRKKEESTYEANGRKFYNICIMDDSGNICYSSFILKDRYLSVTYLLENGSEFDSKIIKIMDNIVATLAPSIK